MQVNQRPGADGFWVWLTLRQIRESSVPGVRANPISFYMMISYGAPKTTHTNNLLRPLKPWLIAVVNINGLGLERTCRVLEASSRPASYTLEPHGSAFTFKLSWVQLNMGAAIIGSRHSCKQLDTCTEELEAEHSFWQVSPC